MIRPMQATDAPDVLALLAWMDDAPEREVFAPDARDVHELRGECEDRVCLVAEGLDGAVEAYCGLAPFRDGLVLEGPLGDGDLPSLLARAVERADGLPVYAFAARDNLAAREALEACGVGCGGPMAPYGEEVSPLNIPAWRGFALRRRLDEHVGVRVDVDNDAKALALGEGWCGAARGVASVPGVRVEPAEGSGDDRIVALVEAEGRGRGCVVVTADRELRRRVAALGAEVRGPRTLLDELGP